MKINKDIILLIMVMIMITILHGMAFSHDVELAYLDKQIEGNR